MTTLNKESFETKQLAEQKGGLYEYHEYAEDNRKIVLRLYDAIVAVDYYVGIDLEDSEHLDVTADGTQWELALKLANDFYKKYEFKGPNNE